MVIALSVPSSCLSKSLEIEPDIMLSTRIIVYFQNFFSEIHKLTRNLLRFREIMPCLQNDPRLEP